MSETPKIISGWSVWLLRSRLRIFVIAEAFKFFGNPFRAISEMKRLGDVRRKVHGSKRISKCIKSGSQYLWNSDYCSFPSERLKNLIQGEFVRNGRNKNTYTGKMAALQTLIWGITNRCPLSCRHCYEWDNLAQTDTLDLKRLSQILSIFKTYGLRHIQFSGGEPLVRFNDLVELIKDASASMDCWLLTSGFVLNREMAATLKSAGLTGVNISLDHWDAQLHNTFRNNEKSFGRALEALSNCIEAGLITSLSLCATREFVSEENLVKYAQLAKNHGAHFIRILEPRATGKFNGQKVSLDDQHVKILSDFAVRFNSDPRYRDFPVISFFGESQRKFGCFGAGNRYIYVDPNGEVHACPFCRGSMGNLSEQSFEEILGKLRTRGCHMFDRYHY